MPTNQQPTIRAAVIAAVKERQMTAYALSKATGKLVSIPHIQGYIDGKTDMTSERLDAVLGVLGLRITHAERKEVSDE